MRSRAPLGEFPNFFGAPWTRSVGEDGTVGRSQRNPRRSLRGLIFVLNSRRASRRGAAAAASVDGSRRGAAAARRDNTRALESCTGILIPKSERDLTQRHARASRGLFFIMGCERRSLVVCGRPRAARRRRRRARRSGAWIGKSGKSNDGGTTTSWESFGAAAYWSRRKPRRRRLAAVDRAVAGPAGAGHGLVRDF